MNIILYIACTSRSTSSDDLEEHRSSIIISRAGTKIKEMAKTPQSEKSAEEDPETDDNSPEEGIELIEEEIQSIMEKRKASAD